MTCWSRIEYRGGHARKSRNEPSHKGKGEILIRSAASRPDAPDDQTITIPDRAADCPLRALPISVRLTNVLTGMGYSSLGDLHGIAYERLAETRNCGTKTIEELKRLVALAQSGQLDSLAEAERLSQYEGDSAECATQAAIGNVEAYRIIVPGQAMDWPLARLPMSGRLSRILQETGASSLTDIHGLIYADLEARPGCGQVTLQELRALIARLHANEFNGRGLDTDEFSMPAVIACIDRAVNSLPDRDRDIITRRLARTRNAPLTLADIGRAYGLTGEGASLIVDKAIDAVIRRTALPLRDELEKLAEVCQSKVCPLTPELLVHLADSNVPTLTFPAEFYVRMLRELDSKIPAWPSGQRVAKQSRMERSIIRDTKAALREVASAISLKDCYEGVKTMWKAPLVTAGQFLEALRKDGSIVVEFRAPGSPVVHPLSPRPQDWIRKVLSESETPLTREVIMERGRELLGTRLRPAVPVSLNCSLRPQYGFYRLGPGVFGLARHIRLPKRLWRKARSDFHHLLKKRRRPASILEVMSEDRFEWSGTTNAYELAQILREDDRFRDLGRFLFALATWSTAERQRVNDLIPRILKEAGHPMSTSAVHKELQRFRFVALSSIPSLVKANPVLRGYGFGYCGLRKWGDRATRYLVDDSHYVNRTIASLGPPLTFAHLCETLSVQLDSHLARVLWRTATSLPKVEATPARRRPDTILSHKTRGRFWSKNGQRAVIRHK